MSSHQPVDPVREQVLRLVCLGMEALVLLLVCLSPWPFGAVHPAWEFYLFAGLALLLALWAVRMLLEWDWSIPWCAVAMCLAGLFLLGLVQLVSWPRWALVLSPGTVQLYDEFMPAHPEVVAGGEATAPAVLAAGATLSLYPGASRTGCLQLLAVFLLFLAVRSTLSSVNSLRRLSAAALINGMLLALFALVQSFSTDGRTLFWTWKVEAPVFGPFICRNHFAFYLNLCIGLGLGLLWDWRQRDPDAGKYPVEETGLGALFGSPLRLLHDPAALWIVAGLALMISSIALSLSRGGVVCLLGAGLICFLLRRRIRARPLSQLDVGIPIGLLALGLLAWFGIDQLEARLQTLLTRTALEEGRLTCWQRVLPGTVPFLLGGTGLGTWRYYEPLSRGPGDDPALVWDHAHNDYLEALVEGGLPRLALSVVAIALVYRLSVRALRRHRSAQGGALVLGAVLGFTTVVLHSFVDFGLHIPAIAVLTTVVAAQLAGLGAPRGRVGRNSRDRDATGPVEAPPVPPEAGETGRTAEVPAARQAGRFPAALGRLVPVGGAVAALLLGLVVVLEGRRAGRAEHYRLGADRLAGRTDPMDREAELVFLEAAVRIAPENARLHLAYAEAHFDRFRRAEKQLGEKRRQFLTLQALAAAAALPDVSFAVLGSLAGTAWNEAPFRNESLLLNRQHLVPALQHYLIARDQCPLLAVPHLRLAAHRDQLSGARPRATYLDRAKRLRPADPDIWFAAGLLELEDGRLSTAWNSFRHSLEASDRYLAAILRRSEALLTPVEMASQLIPANPRLLLAAAQQFETAERGRPFLDKALEQLQAEGGPHSPAEHRLQAQVYLHLNQTDAACAAYQRALALAPDQLDWRFELAEVYFRQGQLVEAREQLEIVVSGRPGHDRARALLRDVLRALALTP